MNHKRFFLRWALLPSLTLVGTLFAMNLGWFKVMHEGDQTHLTYVILGIFTLATLLAGRLSWRIGGLTSNRTVDKVNALKHSVEHGFLAESLCVSLGLLGTVFGFVVMLSGGFGDLSEGGEVTQAAVSQLTSGMATAFITTLVGLICSIILKIQYHFIENALERYS